VRPVDRRAFRMSSPATYPATPKLHFASSVTPSESFVLITPAFAQTAPAAGGDVMSSLGSMLPLLLMFVVLYFVMIRPQMKRQKEHKAMIDALAKGDEVATAGGLLGKVANLDDGQIGLEIASGVVVQLQRHAVVQVLPKGSIK